MKDYPSLPLKEFISDLSSDLPAPGGGSASALVACLGIACLKMVLNFTIGKKGYEQYQDELNEICLKLTQYQNRFIDLMQRDIEAYSNLSVAYKLPKGSDEERKIREINIQQALKDAYAVPESVYIDCVDALKCAERLSEIGNRNLMTDVACGVIFLVAAIESAEYNMVINLNSIKDDEFVKSKKNFISETANVISAYKERTLSRINGILGRE